jgi:hypothetical protein
LFTLLCFWIVNSDCSTSELERTIEIACPFGQPDSTWREGHLIVAISLMSVVVYLPISVTILISKVLMLVRELDATMLVPASRSCLPWT